MESVKSNSILLADDSNTFLMYVGILVKRLGYKTYLARDGVEAIKLAKEKKPSAIVLDYMMPRIDGSSCLSIIRSDPEIKHTPVIVLTSRESTRDEFERLGCCHFLNKPVNIAEFYSALRSCINDKESVLNKRRNIRAPLCLKVTIKCQDEKRELFASAISVGGMFLRTAAPFDTGTEIDMEFSVDHEDPIEIKGKVIYKNLLTTEIETEPGMGILFINIPEDVKYRISYFVMNQIANDLSLEGSNINREIGFDDSLI